MSNTPQRVTIITETFSPEVNGVANTLGHWVNGLLERHIDVQIIRPQQHADDINNRQNGLSTCTLPGLPIPGYAGLKFGLPWQKRIRHALAEFQPDVLYVATEGPLGFAGVRAAKQLQVPVISGFHTNFHQYFGHYHLAWLSGTVYLYLRYFHNRTRQTLVPTAQQQTQLREQGFANVDVLARGVDANLFDPQKRNDTVRRQWGVKRDDCVLLYIGRIAAEKNLDLVLRCYQKLKPNHPHVKLVLVGDGPALASIQREHPEVICTGTQRGKALAQHYASGDVFLFPSKTDTFGNVVTEAMASGLAIVSFDAAAAHEHLQHQHSGMLAPLGDDASYCQHVRQLANNQKLRQQLAHNARRHAEQLSWGSIVDQFVSHLAQATIEGTQHGQHKNSTTNRMAIQQSGSLGS